MARAQERRAPTLAPGKSAHRRSAWSANRTVSAHDKNALHMSRPRRPVLRAEAARRNAELLARLGKEVRESRRRRGLLQREAAALASLTQSAVSRMDTGPWRMLLGGR